MIYGKEAVFPCVESHRIAKCATVVTLTLTALVQPYMGAQAQHNATMYFMHDLPTVNLLNPAFQPEEGNLYIGLPMLSSAYVDGGITLRGIRVGDVRDNKVRLRQTAENASFRESAYANVDINVLNIGTYIGRTYFTLDVAAKGRAEAGLPGDLVKMLWRGNYPYRGKAVSASNTGGYGSAYMEFALGFSREVVPNKITVGGKIKRLEGILYGDVNFGDAAQVYTDPDTWNTTIGLTPEFDIAGLYPTNNISTKGAFTFDTTTMGSNVFKYNGLSGGGFGLDAGFEIKLDRISVSGSVINLGAISWKAKHVALEKVNYIKTLDGSKDAQIYDLAGIADSLKKQETFTGSHRKTLRWTSPTIMLGVSYPLNEHIVVGALGAMTVGRYNSYPLLALSLNTRRYPVNGSVSYSYSHTHNLGLGLIFGQRDVQLHIICDNLLAANYQMAQNINLRVGLNLLFGTKPTGAKKRWSPLNTADPPTNKYKIKGSKQPLNKLSQPAQQPTSKQPLNKLSQPAQQPTSKQPLNMLPQSTAQPASKQPLNPPKDNGGTGTGTNSK